MNGLTIQAPLLNPVDFSADAAVGYLNGGITNKYKAVINFSFQKYTYDIIGSGYGSQGKRLQFSSLAGVNTITNTNLLDTSGFISTYGFLVGETIICPMSISNSGTLTITSITDNVITVSNTLTNEILEVGYIYCNTKITALDFYYNLIANSAQVSFLSQTDAATLQKYTITGIDPTVTAPTNLNIGTKSMAWVTDIITGVASTSTIAGVSFTGYTSITGAYVQSFQIIHYFYQAPFFLPNYVTNFQSETPPSDFQDSQMNGQPVNNGWQYICQLNCKYSAGNIVQNSNLSAGINGTAAWFDMNDVRTTPEFSLNSIAYVNATTGLAMIALDIGQNVNVTMKIKSSSGLFANGKTLVLNYFYCPLTASNFQNTATTLLQNFMFDKAVTTLGASAINGINYGGNYQVLKNVQAVVVDANNATITFQFNLSSFLFALLQTYNTSDRNYCINAAIETTND